MAIGRIPCQNQTSTMLASHEIAEYARSRDEKALWRRQVHHDAHAHRPDAGQATVNGNPYHELRRPLREVGAMLEARSFHPGRSARAHLGALAVSNAIPGRRVEEVLAIVGLEAAGQFSLGMAQRLSIAAALLGEPFDQRDRGVEDRALLSNERFLEGGGEPVGEGAAARADRGLF
jgi:hypothetical protein